jgi:Uma2 family endonuclease
VPEVWLVDLAGDQVEVFREPSAEGYREVRVLRRGESLAPAFLPDLLLPVDGVLG